MSAYVRFLIASLGPLMAGLLAVAVVSGMYLINGGHWEALRFGFSFMLIAKLILPYMLLPGGLLMGFMKLLEHEKPWASLAFYIACLLYFTTLMTGTLYLQLMSVADLMRDPEYDFAAIGWFISASLFPWTVIARADRQNAVLIEIIYILALSALTMTIARLGAHHITAKQIFLAGWGQMAVIMVCKGLYEHFRKPAEVPPPVA